LGIGLVAIVSPLQLDAACACVSDVLQFAG
jgi:hypothetical protein